ncbi:MAG: hypothetical protein CVU22_20870 [Betaproteobacteria bacterium HGW-Betaproteobacteria-16]|nr:MAG: hypothetical protein CVU22_20870 [Betaproteobacteria bacterium HGW-Betaproteobacteria-16]
MHRNPPTPILQDNGTTNFFVRQYGGPRTVYWLGALMRAVYCVAPAVSINIALRLFTKPRLRVPQPMCVRSSSGWQPIEIPFEGHTIEVLRHEGTDERPKVLLAHGWGGSAEQMLLIAELLIAAGFRPYVISFPAHGRSGGSRTNIAQFSRALFALQAWHGRFCGMIAHSAGALAAAHAITRGFAADRLVLIAPPVSPPKVVDIVGAAFKLPEIWNRLLIDRMNRKGGTDLSEFEIEHMAPRLFQPTLIIHDEGDRVAPASNSRSMASLLPNGRLHTTEGLGHQRILQDKEVGSLIVEHISMPISACISPISEMII